ncbi:MAG: MFS transporter [Pseudomonadota bacterium]
MTDTARPLLNPGAQVRAQIVLGMGLALMAMGQTVLFALLGPIGRELGLTEIMVGGIISLAAATVVLASPWWGRRVDEIGRRPVFLTSMVGLAITVLLFTLALEAGLRGYWSGWLAFGVLAATRMLYGFAVTGAQPSAAGWIADTTSAEKRTGGMAIIGAAYGLGSILGPTLAWILSGYSLLAPLYLIAAFGLGAACLVAFTVPETNPGRAPTRAKLRASDRRVRATVILAVSVFAVVAAVQQTVAFYVQDTSGLDTAGTAAEVGKAMALLALMMFLSQAVIAGLKPMPSTLIAIGALVGTVGCVVLAAWPSSMGLYLSHALFGLGFGTVIPGLQGQGSLAVEADEQGSVGGIVAAGMAGGYAVGPLAGTALYALLPVLPYLLAAGVMTIVSLYAFAAIARHRST